jgi:hypothetical protein
MNGIILPVCYCNLFPTKDIWPQSRPTLPDTPVYKNNITNIKYKYLFSFGSTGV